MIIYKITNTINGKIYIGQTHQSLIRRFYTHCNRSNGCTILGPAITKYGKENFIIEEIDRAATTEELNAKEIHWIEFYNARCKTVGYNVAKGGRAKPLSSEAKLKSAESKIGKKHSVDTIEKMKKTQQNRRPQTEQEILKAKIGIRKSWLKKLETNDMIFINKYRNKFLVKIFGTRLESFKTIEQAKLFRNEYVKRFDNNILYEVQ
jgi:group I intron endonuclease